MKIDELIQQIQAANSGANDEVLIRNEDGDYAEVEVGFTRVNLDGQAPFKFDNDRPMVMVLTPAGEM